MIYIGELEAQIVFISQPFTSIKIISLPGVKFVLKFDTGVGQQQTNRLSVLK